MAESLAEIYPPPPAIISGGGGGGRDATATRTNSPQPTNKRPTASGISWAPNFKHQANFCARDIEQVRRLLTIERATQDGDDYKFWTPDYERMMKDDWLVTRFLLRGHKASQKQQLAAASMMTTTTAWSKCGDDGGDETAPTHLTCESSSSSSSPSLVHINTLELIKSCAKFRRDHRISPLTKASEFPADWLSVNGVFNYKPDLAGNPTVYMRIKLHKPKLIENSELRHQFKRLLLYTLERADQELYNEPGKGICSIFDMTDATFENVDLELVSWMVKSFKSCSPKLLCYVIVYNLPWFFSATFKLIAKTLMSQSNRQSIRFVYGNEILHYIGHNSLPLYMMRDGGVVVCK